MVNIVGETPKARLHELTDVDLVIVACGYEARASAIADRVDFGSARKLALVFDNNHVLSFADNEKLLRSKGFVLEERSDDGIKEIVAREIRSLAAKRQTETLRVFVDISSQSRARMAQIVEAFVTACPQRTIHAFFGYSPAAYVPPPTAQLPNVSIGPVSPFFAGWPADAEQPTALVIGLGYEPDRALGAVEYLEPSSVWALLPKSAEEKFDASLRTSNAQLLASIGSRHILTYRVEDPNSTLALLSSLVAHLSPMSTVLLLPSGPKILGLLALLFASKDRAMSVWRVSAADDPPTDRHATGQIILIECIFNGAAT